MKKYLLLLMCFLSVTCLLFGNHSGVGIQWFVKEHANFRYDAIEYWTYFRLHTGYSSFNEKTGKGVEDSEWVTISDWTNSYYSADYIYDYKNLYNKMVESFNANFTESADENIRFYNNIEGCEGSYYFWYGVSVRNSFLYTINTWNN